MIELKGSEKQISWAEKIRTKIISEMEERYFRFCNLSELQGNPEEYQKYVNSLSEEYQKRFSALEALKNVKSAAWWIDRRGQEMPIFFRDAVAGRLE